MLKALKESTLSNHDKSHALNTLLYTVKAADINDENQKSFEELLKYHKQLPTHKCTVDENTFMAQDLQWRLGNKSEPKSEDLKFTETYLAYLYEGDFNTFKDLISKGWQEIDINKNVTPTYRRTPERDAQSKAAFDSFENDSLKTFAKALYFSVPLSKETKFGFTNFRRSSNSTSRNEKGRRALQKHNFQRSKT